MKTDKRTMYMRCFIQIYLLFIQCITVFLEEILPLKDVNIISECLFGSQKGES